MSDYIKKIQEEAAALAKKLTAEAATLYRYRVDAIGTDGLPYIPDFVSTETQALASAEARNQFGCTDIKITDLQTKKTTGYVNVPTKP